MAAAGYVLAILSGGIVGLTLGIVGGGGSNPGGLAGGFACLQLVQRLSQQKGLLNRIFAVLVILIAIHVILKSSGLA